MIDVKALEANQEGLGAGSHQNLTYDTVGVTSESMRALNTRERQNSLVASMPALELVEVSQNSGSQHFVMKGESRWSVTQSADGNTVREESGNVYKETKKNADGSVY